MSAHNFAHLVAPQEKGAKGLSRKKKNGKSSRANTVHWKHVLQLEEIKDAKVYRTCGAGGIQRAGGT